MSEARGEQCRQTAKDLDGEAAVYEHNQSHIGELFSPSLRQLLADMQDGGVTRLCPSSSDCTQTMKSTDSEMANKPETLHRQPQLRLLPSYNDVFFPQQMMLTVTQQCLL